MNKFHDYKITIITLVRNNEIYLQDVVSSLIAQTNENWVSLIINDGGRKKINIQDYLLNNLQHENKFTIINLPEWHGLVSCHKLAIEYCKTEIIGILDADDALDKTAIQEVLHIYNNTDEDVYIYTNFWFCDCKLIKKLKGNSSEVKTSFLHDRPGNPFRTFMKTSYLKTVGYDDDLQFGAEDVDILIKLEKVAKPIFLNKELYLYRQHNTLSSISSLRTLSMHSLYLSLFKNIYNRYNSLLFTLKIYLQNSNSYNLSRNLRNLHQKCYIVSNKKYYFELYSGLGDVFISTINYLINKKILDIMIFDDQKTNSVLNKEMYIFTDIKISWSFKYNEFIINSNNNLISNQQIDSYDISVNLDNFKKIYPNIYFNKIYVRNSKSDTIKRQQIEKIFKQSNIYFSFFNTANDFDLIEILEDAEKKKYKKILICNNTILLNSNFSDLFDKYIRTIPYDWSILFLDSEKKVIGYDILIFKKLIEHIKNQEIINHTLKNFNYHFEDLSISTYTMPYMGSSFCKSIGYVASQ